MITDKQFREARSNGDKKTMIQYYEELIDSAKNKNITKFKNGKHKYDDLIKNLEAKISALK